MQPITTLPVYRILSEHLKPALQVRIISLYEARLHKTPSYAVLDHLIEVGMKQLRTEVEHAHDLQMSADISVKAIVQNMMALVAEEIDREAKPVPAV